MVSLDHRQATPLCPAQPWWRGFQLEPSRSALNVTMRSSDSGRKGRPILPERRDTVGEFIMRKIYRTLALRTRSDERALRLAIVALALSLFAVLLLHRLIA